MDKYLLNLGFINITWYAFFIVSGMILGAILVLNNKKVRQVLTKDELYDYFFWVIIFGILGARLWYVTFSLSFYIYNPLQIFAIWNGGLAIHGGIIAGFLYTIYFSKKHFISTFILTDACIAPLLLAQAIGRFGNFINQEAHGPATTYDFLKNTLHLPEFIVQGMYINGTYYQPTFLYEALWNFLGFLIIIFILNNLWKNKNGYLTAFYLMWYGFIRIFIEQLRTDALMLFNIKIAQLTSFIMLVCGIILLIILIKKDQQNGQTTK